ncbi:MAG: LysR substrate-binding domain-containing protein [Bauldia sp.]
MLDRFSGMEIFLRVAGAGSFSAAARALGISQTMVTKHVVAIEERLGVRLFQRTTRKLTLTEAGARYREAAERILAELAEADGEAAATVTEPRGTLRINAPLSFGFRQIAPAATDFARLYPQLTIDMGLNDRVIDLVEEGWDLAIRIGQLRDSILIARKLAPIRTVLCAAPAYLERHGSPRTVADLQAHNCLGYTLPSAAGAGRWHFGGDGSMGVNVTGNFRANNGDALRTAALAGQGIVYQPTFLLSDDLRKGDLVPLKLDQPTFQFANAFAVYAPDRHVPAKIRTFIDFLAARWAGEPPWDVGLSLDPS